MLDLLAFLIQQELFNPISLPPPPRSFINYVGKRKALRIFCSLPNVLIVYENFFIIHAASGCLSVKKINAKALGRKANVERASEQAQIVVHKSKLIFSRFFF
jgi:hypothetical protein